MSAYQINEEQTMGEDPIQMDVNDDGVMDMWTADTLRLGDDMEPASVDLEVDPTYRVHDEAIVISENIEAIPALVANKEAECDSVGFKRSDKPIGEETH